MKKVIISIGMPGSGKTRTLKKFAKKYGYGYISPDDIRIEILRNVADQSRNEEIANEVRKRAKKLLDAGKTVVVDAVFSNADGRKEFLDFAKKSGAQEVQGVMFDVPVEIAKKRNIRRKDHRVPEPTIEKIAEELESSRPKIGEGFDGIFTLNEYGNLIEAEITRGKVLAKRGLK